MKNLNRYQRALIKLLQEDAQQSINTLAAKLDISPSSVHRMIHSLIKENVFRIVAVVDPVKAGLAIAAVIGFDVDNEKWKLVIEKLNSHPSINMVSKTTGPFDLLAFSRFKCLYDLEQFLKMILATTDGIRHSETFICFDVLKGRYTPLPPTDIDSSNRDLITLIQKDARQSTEFLSRKLGVSPSTIQRNIRKLLMGGYIKIVAVTNPMRMEQTLAVAVGINVQPTKWDEVAHKLAEQPMVRFVAKTNGRYDIWAFMRFESTDELSGYLETLPENIKGIVNSETFICLDISYGPMYHGWPYLFPMRI